MPKVTANCIFNAYIGVTPDSKPSEQSAGGPYAKPVEPGGCFFQFNLPKLEEVHISAVRFFFYVRSKGQYTTIHFRAFDWFKSLQGEPRETYETMRNHYMIGEADEEFVGDKLVSNYNKFESIDITNLVIGYLGRNYYTIDMISELTENNFPRDHTAVDLIKSGHVPYIEIEYDYAIPFKPTIIYPAGDTVENKGTMKFEWKYTSSGTSGQKKFDLQWKMQSSNTWNTVTQETGNTFYLMDATRFTNGIVEWRVRTYNLHNMVSEWAESQFVVIGKPGNPVISGVKNDAITEISWNANKGEESAARVRIARGGVEIYDSGVIPAGMEDIHKPDLMLDNGNYIAYLSISNMYDMWSSEISYPFTINNPKPTAPVLSAAGMQDYVRLLYTGTANEYFIFRAEGNGEFIPIARTRETHFEDYAVKSGKRYRYYVRAYSKAYADSSVKDVSVQYRGYIFSAVSDMAQRITFFFHANEERVPFEKIIALDSSLIFYSGRKKPVKESGIHENRSEMISAYLEKGDAERLERFLSGNDIYCLRSGDLVAYCDVTGASASTAFLGKGYEVSLTLQEVHYDERVKFNA